MQVNDKVKVYLETHGFDYHEYDDTWVDGYFDIDSIVAVLSFNTDCDYGYKITINNYDVFNEEQLENFKDRISDLRRIYYIALELKDK